MAELVERLMAELDSRGAGAVLKQHGLDAGLTEELVSELDAARCKQKPDEAKAIMAWAWHAIRDYLGQQ